jgi:hypothetical protein
LIILNTNHFIMPLDIVTSIESFMFSARRYELTIISCLSSRNPEYDYVALTESGSNPESDRYPVIFRISPED